MIYHLFNASMTHLVPNIIKGILKHAPLMHNDWPKEITIFLWVPDNMLFGEKDAELNKYRILFKEYPFYNFKFIEGNLNMLRMVFGINTHNDTLIIHSDFTLFKSYPLFLLLLGSRGKRFLNRIAKIEWGVTANQPLKTLKRKVKFLIRNYVYSHFKYVVTLSPDDKLITESKYPKATVIHASYFKFTESFIIDKPKIFNSEALKILVSHSGHIHNNHFKSFELLSKFKGENIEIMCPLCYGPEEYIKQVIVKGKEMFGNKFNYFTDLKPFDQYVALIAEHDVYVTSATIQTGLFAAFSSLSNGLKVYLGSNLFDFLNNTGYVVFEVNEINQSNYRDFSKPLSHSAFFSNQELYINQQNDEELFNIWRKIYGTENLWLLGNRE
jgi:hypothetical protein